MILKLKTEHSKTARYTSNRNMNVAEISAKKSDSPPGPASKDHKSKQQNDAVNSIRGSTLLLMGRILSVGMNFISQILLVRYLSKADYGAWAYALSVVSFFQVISSFGFKNAISRYLPYYSERKEYPKMFGLLLLVAATIALLSTMVITLIFLFPSLPQKLVSQSDFPVLIVTILIFAVPIESFDRALMALFASLDKPLAIFWRKYLLSPALKLTLVLIVIYFQKNLYFLSYGYIIVGMTGLALYSALLIRLLKTQSAQTPHSFRSLQFPVRELYGFSIPLFTTEMMAMLLLTADTFFLGYFHGTETLATYRVILPLAQLNTMIKMTFSLLFMPAVARLWAKGNHQAMNQLYWQTAQWLALLSFPLFALTFASAENLTSLFYGERYQGSWLYLQILAAAYFFDISLGFNALTLKVTGRIRYIVAINIIAVTANIILNILLIPEWGALGAAIATALSVMIHALLKQTGLAGVGSVMPLNASYFSRVILFVTCTALLYLFFTLTGSHIIIQVSLTTLVWLLLLRLLNIGDIFPELKKIPFLRYFLN
ncbi:oligosaccharide flippase family protein [candidate division KSB1 bacterium]|nr:oligosaccharide flippase family protein [candidate division KSB1 bacterium]